MLRQSNPSQAKPIAGQWGGNKGQYGIMTAGEFKKAYEAVLAGPFQMQSSVEDSPVIARDIRGLVDISNETTVKYIERYFGVPIKADDTPAVEIEAVFVISGGNHNPGSKRSNAANFYRDYLGVLGPDAVNATIADGVAFLVKYWPWSDQEAMAVLAQYGLAEDSTSPLIPPAKA